MPTSPAAHRSAPGWPDALWLVRHGESLGNVADRRARDSGSGRIELDHRDADVPLSDLGTRQAEALGRWIAGRPADERPTVVLSSPYERAAATARFAVDGGGLDVELRLDERLRERDLGVLDGLTGMGVRDLMPEEAARRRLVGKLYYRPPGGESWADVALRLRSFLADLQQEHAGDRVLVATHQAVIMVFRYVLEGLPERELLEIDAGEQVSNCSLTRYEQAGQGGLRLGCFNDASPVADLGEPVTEEPDREEPDQDEPDREEQRAAGA